MQECSLFSTPSPAFIACRFFDDGHSDRYEVSIVIFTMLILPIQEHGISLHLFESSLISFISVLQFSTYRSFVSLDRFIPRYFILFVAVVNGSVSLISLSDS